MEQSTLLNWIIFLPLLGAVLTLAAPSARAVKAIAVGITGAVFLLSLKLFGPFIAGQFGMSYGSADALQFVFQRDWIRVGTFNIQYFVGLDGLSFPLVILTTLISFLACLASLNFEHWTNHHGIKGYFALFLLLETGMIGTFAALDFFLFYIFWEVMLLPMYFLIGVWGGPRKEYAAIKFFLYTLLGSVLMLVALLAMYFKAGEVGVHTFSLVEYATNGAVQKIFNDPNTLFLGKNFAICMFVMLYIGFAVKVPMFPFHTWLPDAHVEAPTPISMILAGVLLKMGGYGLLRICYPIFPSAGKAAALVLALLGVINIIYGALCAMAQSDFKRLVAYSSVSHMGYVMLGIAIMTATGFQGAMFQMLAHGISSPMCFFLVGVIYDRAHHRDIDRFGGLWLSMPVYGSLATLGFFASLGLPTLCGFIGEAWVLLGTYSAPFTWAPPMAVAAAFGVVLTAGYILWLIQRVYLGKERADHAGFPDASSREVFVLSVLGALCIWMGVYPSWTFGLMNGTLDQILAHISGIGG